MVFVGSGRGDYGNDDEYIGNDGVGDDVDAGDEHEDISSVGGRGVGAGRFC